ncbi:uncharacterized protein LOC111275856 isoform X3 [Durio zibethinus]|uniref:Uncharacterized protein LOC111275856 isoform X3 n=1 Tax=Durio zibethinus TaxID=66656 RepID=A0A6P5WM21_DURZI|nr:uncharacterized protein LOC111275856 isoform X3 [Durio zibethinus]
MVLSIKFNAHLDVGFCCLLIPHFLYRTSWLNLLVQSTRLNLLSFYVNKKAASVSSSSFQTQVDGAYITSQEVADIRNQRNVNEEDILNKLQLFKQFDTVEDFSDHHYASSGASTKQPLKNLKRNLPDMKRTVCIPSIIFRMEKLVHALLIQAQKLKLDVEISRFFLLIVGPTRQAVFIGSPRPEVEDVHSIPSRGETLARFKKRLCSESKF